MCCTFDKPHFKLSSIIPPMYNCLLHGTVSNEVKVLIRVNIFLKIATITLFDSPAEVENYYALFILPSFFSFPF